VTKIKFQSTFEVFSELEFKIFSGLHGQSTSEGERRVATCVRMERHDIARACLKK
jgi:hypothetical protein